MRLGSPSIFNPQGFHHDPTAAGVFVPGLAQTSIAGVSGLAKTPSPSIASLPTLELGRSYSDAFLGVGGPTPKRLALSPVSPQAPEVQPALRDGYTFQEPSPGSSQVAQATASEPFQNTPVAPAIDPETQKATPPQMENPTPKTIQPPPPPPKLSGVAPPPPKVSGVPPPSGELPVPTNSPGGGNQPAGSMYSDGTYWRSM